MREQHAAIMLLQMLTWERVAAARLFPFLPVKAGGWPLKIEMVEKHPLGSQAFMPLEHKDWLVVVADSVEVPAAKNCHAFVARGDQGVQYAAGVWHHPLLPTDGNQSFLVVDRYAPAEPSDANLVEHWFDGEAASIDQINN